MTSNTCAIASAGDFHSLAQSRARGCSTDPHWGRSCRRGPAGALQRSGSADSFCFVMRLRHSSSLFSARGWRRRQFMPFSARGRGRPRGVMSGPHGDGPNRRVASAEALHERLECARRREGHERWQRYDAAREDEHDEARASSASQRSASRPASASASTIPRVSLISTAPFARRRGRLSRHAPEARRAAHVEAHTHARADRRRALGETLNVSGGPRAAPRGGRRFDTHVDAPPEAPARRCPMRAPS